MTPPNSAIPPAYALDGLTKVYQRRTVLDIERLNLARGRIHALLGPNGAGKTTLLNILAFLSPPSAGTIHFYGRRARFSEKNLRVLRRNVVMVEQHPILFTTTVYKNLEFGLKVRKVPRKEREGMIAENLELVGMESFIHAPAHRLSGGETQRVALARALALNPRVLLCDEPTSSVDVENQAIITQILRQINAEQRITIVFTTHDRAQAADLAHRTLLLDHGRLVPARYENIFSGTLEPGEDGLLRCAIHPQIALELDPRVMDGTLPPHPRIFINPHRIEPLSGSADASGANVLAGVLRRAVSANGRVRLVVDAGAPLTLILTEAAYRASRPLVGDTLKFRIPPAAIEILSSKS